jgi:hypothetical protein
MQKLCKDIQETDKRGFGVGLKPDFALYISQTSSLTM